MNHTVTCRAVICCFTYMNHNCTSWPSICFYFKKSQASQTKKRPQRNHHINTKWCLYSLLSFSHFFLMLSYSSVNSILACCACQAPFPICLFIKVHGVYLKYALECCHYSMWKSFFFMSCCMQGVWYRVLWCLIWQKNTFHNFILKQCILMCIHQTVKVMCMTALMFLDLNEDLSMKSNPNKPPHVLFEWKFPRAT